MERRPRSEDCCVLSQVREVAGCTHSWALVLTSRDKDRGTYAPLRGKVLPLICPTRNGPLPCRSSPRPMFQGRQDAVMDCKRFQRIVCVCSKKRIHNMRTNIVINDNLMRSQERREGNERDSQVRHR